MSSRNHLRIASHLVERGIARDVAGHAAGILDRQDVSLINVQSAFRLGRGISWDLVQEAIKGGEGRVRFNEAISRSSAKLWREEV